MKDLWRLNRRFVAPQDVVFERAFHRYGGARAWIADRLTLPQDARVLEVGYGQGLFTVELASRIPEGLVLGIDILADVTTLGPARSLARRTRLSKRIAFVRSNALYLPFRKATFGGVASFLALGDIAMFSGSSRIETLVRELGRVARPGCVVSLADECFPECRPAGAQGRLFDTMRRYWRNRLPSVTRIVHMLEGAGFRDVKVDAFDPSETLPPKDAERELRLGVVWARPQGVRFAFRHFWREVSDIVISEGRRYPRVLLVTGARAG